ncbi:hypothetical protein [Lentzea flava]|nr:hypothetical protein [Lentzea flava]MCP2198341.1 hypothetical protein [Lentzea flava]
MWTRSKTLGGITTEGSKGMRRTRDRVAQIAAFALVAGVATTLVLLALWL